MKSACRKEFDSLVPSFNCRSRRSEILRLRTCGCIGDSTGDDSSADKDFSLLRDDGARFDWSVGVAVGGGGVGDAPILLILLFSSAPLVVDFSSAVVFLFRLALLL